DAVRAFFESLEMGAADAWTLFAALDADGDNVISAWTVVIRGATDASGLKDFTERCIQLHGPARSVDLYALTQQNAPSVEPGDGGDVKDRRGEEGSNKRKVCVVCV
ncbi:Uncharacterized protein SCF082_LOCUS24757, partial [Durusdinium trenchii]